MQSSAPCPQASEPNSGRRWFLRVMTAGLGTAATAILGIPIVGYFFGQRKREADWVTLGDVGSFPLHETRRVDFDNPFRQPWDGVASLTGVFVRNEGQDGRAEHQFRVLSVHCAHLGCPVSWFPQSGLFMCPCHGGVYYANGDLASGPPPRGMYHCDWQIENGQLKVRAPHYPTLQDTLEQAT